ncbi:MAG: glutamyl-tRNA reductase [Fimbriimonas sp.]|nr:glutamyl-tRNA reductase [Fimbriimonas sp.]
MPNRPDLDGAPADVDASLGVASVVADFASVTPFADEISEQVPVSLLGISHHTATLRIRGKVGFSGSALERVLIRFLESGFDECMVLSTCNRTEIYTVGGCREEAERILIEESGLSIDDLNNCFYSKLGLNAIHHLFSVFSGLDSAVIGETEILAQIKDAVATGRKVNSIGRHIDFAVRRGHSTSRLVRSKTELCRNVTSIGSLAVRDAATTCGGLRDKNVVVVGAGKIAERIAKDLIGHGPMRLVFLNRTYSNAASLARRYNGQARPFTDLEFSLGEADAAFAATSADRPLLSADATAHLSLIRERYPLTVVDLGVPPNIHPSASWLPGIRLLDMDEMVARCTANSQRRLAAIPIAQEILNEQLAEYLVECEKRMASPTIEVLVRYTDEVRENNLRWAQERLSHLSEQDLKIVSDLANRMVKGFLQSPIRELKEEVATPTSRDVVAKLFRVESGGDSDR